MDLQATRAWLDGVDELYMDGASPDDGHTPERMLENMRELIGAVRGLLVAVEAAVKSGKAPIYICNGLLIVEGSAPMKPGEVRVVPLSERRTASSPPADWGT